MMILLRLCALLSSLLYISPGLSLESEVSRTVPTVVNTSTNEENGVSTLASEEEISLEPSEKIVQKRHVHSIVDKLLEEESSEVVQSEAMSKQVQVLQNNIKTLQSAMDEFLKAQGSMDSRARKLYSRVNQAFSDYFGEKVVAKEVNNSKLETSSKKKKKSRKEPRKSKQQIFTVKKNAPMVNSYLRRVYNNNAYKIKSYGNSVYPTKSYGSIKTSLNPVRSSRKDYSQRYTVKKQLSTSKNKLCCGRGR